MSATRILHLTHTDIRYDNRVLKEMEALAATPNKVVSGIGVEADEGAAHSRRSVGAQIIIERLLSRKLKYAPRVVRHGFVLIELLLRFSLKGLKFRPHVVHCHDTMILPVGVIIKMFRGCKLVYDAHELESDKNGSTPFISGAIRWIERASWSRIDLLISVSTSIVDWYNEKLGSKPSLVILNSPVMQSKDDDTASHVSPVHKGYFREKFDIPGDRLVFVYVGLFGVGRGLEQLVEIFSSSEVRSHVVFVGYGELKTQLLEAAGREPRIHVHDAVPHEQLVSLIRHADIGLCLIEAVSLSDYYCLPNKLFEYCFAGLPVLASRFPEMERIVEEFQLGCCSDLDSESIKAAIKSIEQSPPGTIHRDLSPLSWNAQESKLVRAYEGLLENISSNGESRLR